MTTGRVLEPDADAGGVTAVCRRRRKDGTRGPIVPWYDLEFAEAAAVAASSAEPGQPPVEQVASLLPRTLDDVARLVRQRSPTAVVLAADDDTIGAAQLLAQRFEVPVIIESGPSSPLAQACGVVASAWASPYLDDAAATSPYVHAGTPATAAPVLGVGAAWQRDRAVAVRTIQAVAEDLRLLDGQLPAGSTVPVIGSGVVLEAGGLGPSELPWRGLRRVRPAPVVTLAQADRLLDGGTAIKTPLLRVVVTPRPGDAQRLRRVVVRAAGVGIDVEVVVDLDSASATADVVAGHPTKGTGAADPPDVVLHAARSVLEVAPEADLVASQPVLERLEDIATGSRLGPRCGRPPRLARIGHAVFATPPDDPLAGAHAITELLEAAGLPASLDGLREAGASVSVTAVSEFIDETERLWGSHGRLRGVARSELEAFYTSALVPVASDGTSLTLT